MRAVLLALALLMAGCTQPAASPPLAAEAPLVDEPARAPALVQGFHRVADLPALQAALAAHPASVAGPFVLGHSVGGAEILGLRLIAPGAPAADRVRVLIDGGIHGNEVYGTEAALYLAAWLVENYERNATARRILETTDLHVVGLLNPDGRNADARENAHAVDLNRNFDVDFGNPNPLCRSQSVSPLLPYYYAGPAPLSEPETSALAMYMEQLQPQIYLSHHTGRHALIRPWSACEPPAPMPDADDALFEAIEAWARANTAFQNTGTAAETADRVFPPGAASGSSADWCYLTYHCVALVLEVNEAYGEGAIDPAAVSGEALPMSLHLLEHAQDYAAWRIPSP
ncbi:MAG TPA: M14 family metallopeptidase [Candidatus Thermoplasmatota archaeon]|jgi:hypothetical protein|nr:M14 family metallopeptidase [Candidatus Thermoplasmatota archaeon]